MLKKAIRAAIRMTKQWLQENSNTGEQEFPDKQNFAHEPLLYPLLRAMFLWIMADRECFTRPSYAWGLLQAAAFADALGLPRISAIEFGVAGGNGLLALEKIAQRIEELYPVGIDVYGFDTGAGLPKPVDYRDCPNLWSEGDYPTDRQMLEARLQRAHLFWGLVEDTIPQFLNTRPSPVAFISFDLDLYSSTMHAFKVFEAPTDILLPRIHCYFDDIMGFTFAEFNGERLAISEFNHSHEMRKISLIFGLKYYVPPVYSDDMWVEKSYMAHIFDHHQYGHRDGLARRLCMPLAG